MMAFIDNQVAIAGDAIVYTPPNHALNKRNINDAAGFAPPTADITDRNPAENRECRKPLDPLLEQLAPMHQISVLTAPLRDQPCGDDGFSETPWWRQDAVVMAKNRTRRDGLLGAQPRRERHA